jgi:hypothetical protein
MPIERVTHLNPPDKDNRSLCGRLLGKIKWSRDKGDVTCNNCLRLMK